MVTIRKVPQMVAKGRLILAGIPALDEEATIAKVVIGTRKHVDQVVVYDDGSKDMTSAIAQGLGAIVIRSERNLGKGEALHSIFRKAREMGADVLVTLDADCQHDPEEIPKLVSALMENGTDIVVGSRFISNASSIPAHRRHANRMLNVLTESSLDGVTDTQSGFRAYGKQAIMALNPAERGMSVDSEILMAARDSGLRISEVPISVSYEGRTSKHHPLYHGLDVFSSLIKLISIRHPLLFYAIPGAILFLVGIGLGSLALQSYSQHGYLPTNLTLVAFSVGLIGLLAAFTGIILFTITTVVRKQG